MGSAAPIRSKILVVEDDAILRLMAAEMMQDAGFEVLEADSADEALRILDNRTDVRVVFTDIEMPGSMDGISLARFIRSRWPTIAVIVTSGRYTGHDVDLPAGGLFFTKPYDPRQVVTAIRKY